MMSWISNLKHISWIRKVKIVLIVSFTLMMFSLVASFLTDLQELMFKLTVFFGLHTAASFSLLFIMQINSVSFRHKEKRAQQFIRTIVYSTISGVVVLVVSLFFPYIGIGVK